MVLGNVRSLREWSVTGHHPGIFVRQRQENLGRADRSSDVSAIGKVDGLMALGVVHRIASAKHVSIRKVNPDIAISVRVVDMCKHSYSATSFERNATAYIGLLWQRFRCDRRRGQHSFS
jgi:hypothetical protein